jgi:hypothetical protein
MIRSSAEAKKLPLMPLPAGYLYQVRAAKAAKLAQAREAAAQGAVGKTCIAVLNFVLNSVLNSVPTGNLPATHHPKLTNVGSIQCHRR